MNRVILLGRISRDPECKFTPKGTAVCKFGLAINRRWKNETGEQKDEVTFVDVDCFGRTAENVAQYFKKGRQMLLEGRLKLDQWEDKQSCQKRQRLGVVLESFHFVGDKQEQGQPQEQPNRQSATTTGAEPATDDVPF